MKNKSKIQVLMELFYVLAIVVVCFKLLYEISGVMDIRFYDETVYLGRGVQLNWNSLFKDGFVYFVWYKLLSLFVQDNVTLYYLNYILLFLINPLLMYILLRKMGRERFGSAFFSIALLAANITIITWPFITRFATALILCTFILILSVKTKKAKYVIALCGLSLLIYTRPEYVLSLVLFSIVSLSCLMYKFIKSRKRVFAFLALFTLLLSVFIVFIKGPAKAGRSVMAFGQHYAVNLHQEGKISINPNTNWRKVMKDRFGTDRSITKAFLNNPKEMIGHLVTNIRRLPGRVIALSLPYKTKNKFGTKLIFLIIAGFLIFISIINSVRGIKGKGWKQFLSPVENNPGLNINDGIFYFLSIIIIIPLVISVCLVYPREHYLLVLFTVVLVMVVKNLPGIPKNAILKKFRWVPYAVILFILYAVPWRVSGTRGTLPQDIQPLQKCSNLKKISFIKSIKAVSKIVFLGAHGSMEPYIDNLQHVSEMEKDVSFNEFLEQMKINMIWVDKALRKDTRFRDDDEFKDFLSAIPNDAWEKIDIPSCRGCLAVKKEIL
jgi:hypothetical protein